MLFVRVDRLADADSFLARAGNFLLQREAEHNLILGLSAGLRHNPRTYGHDPYLAVVVERERVVAAALRTPPHNLVLSEVDDLRALEPLGANVSAAFAELPGALGPKEAVGRFAQAWGAQAGVAPRIGLAQRIYRAEEAIAPEGVPGRMRAYADADHALVLDWFEAFATEALPSRPPEDAATALERRLTEPDGGVVIWEDDGPVCFAGFGGPTPNGIRIGPVYTPPEARRRGYASVLTAELTRTLFEGGRRFCFLFTDLANPTSNTIYQRIGYRPVTDVDQWAFGAEAG